MNKLILVIVEGATDANYLAPICKLSKEKKIKFKITKGDILTRLDTNHLNIEEKINIIVDEFLKLNKLHYSDLVSVVHICDLDGTYIDDDKIVTDHSLTKTKYFRDKIVNAERFKNSI